MQEILDAMRMLAGLNPVLESKILSTLFSLAALWLLRMLIGSLIAREVKSNKIEYETRKAVDYAALFLGVLIVGRIWFEGFQSLTTIIGFASAGLAIALKDPLANLAGWLYLLWDDPFDVGHRIEIDGVKGDIVDQNIFHFTVMEIGNWVKGDKNTGRMVHIPNSSVFTKSLSNYTADFPYLWDEMEIRITFESNWQSAKRIVSDILDEHVSEMAEEAQEALKQASHKFMIFDTAVGMKPQIFVSVQEWGVRLSAYYVVDCYKRRGLSAKLWEHVLSEFEKHKDIRFAYPSLQIHNNDLGPEIRTLGPSGAPMR